MSLELTPFIMLNGNAKEAVAFYEKALGAEVLFKQTFGEAPDIDANPIPKGAENLLAHSVLNVGDSVLFVTDFAPDHPNRSGNQVNICITTRDASQSKQLYESLLEGGQTDIPLQETHFSPAYGMVTDKFGVTFQIFTRKN